MNDQHALVAKLQEPSSRGCEAFSRGDPVSIFDVAIVGGGLVGASLALALAEESALKIALIDARMPSLNDPRLFALTAGSCTLLQNIRQWHKLQPHATPIHEVHASYQKHFGSVRFTRETIGLDVLGYVVPAHSIETVLQEALLSESRITLYRPAHLEHIDQTETHCVLHIKEQSGLTTLIAHRVIGADGTHSSVRTLLNMQANTVDYGQSALVTRTVLSRPHRHIAYERFHADQAGAIAMLPLAGENCATIWTADTARIHELMQLSDQDFLHALQHAFGYRLGRLQAIAARSLYPLTLVRVANPVRHNVFLIGNAAHTLHPIAAQGLNLALYEVAALVEGLRAKKDFHSIYRTLQLQLTTSVGLSHGLADLFAYRAGFVRAALQLGMVGLDRLAPLKKRLLGSMLGQKPQMPSLLKAKDNDKSKSGYR